MTGREGTTIGPYRLLRRLGSGGAGTVYLAEGLTGAQQTGKVAIKLLAGTSTDPTVREIARVSQAAADLQHAHVVPLFSPVQQDNTLGIVMAYAPGGSLDDTLRTPRMETGKALALPLPGGVVVRLVQQIARALLVAHTAGIVHGDLRPSNIFVRTAPGGQPLAAISDFGQSMLSRAAAALVASGTASVDQQAWAAAQLAFAAPEQLRGELSPAADQYALAAIAYLLLTGETPFAGDASRILAAVARDPVPNPSALNPSLPEEAADVLMRALAKNPADRFASLDDFALALEAALPAGPGASQSGMGLTQQFSRLSAETLESMQRGDSPALPAQAPVEPADPSPRLNRRLAIIAGVAMLVIMAACGFGFRSFEGGAVLPHITLSGSYLPGASAKVPTGTPDTSASARADEARLRAIVGGQPVFGDALSSNSHHWATDNSTVFFTNQTLHLRDQSATSVALVDAPGDPTSASGDIVAQVSVAQVGGKVGDLAGLRFLVASNADGSQSYYSFVVSSDGRYEVWFHDDSRWVFLVSGYSTAIKTGLNQHNTLAALTSSTRNEAVLFANGQFVTRVSLDPNGPVAGSAGLIVMDNGDESAFTQFALYDAGGN